MSKIKTTDMSLARLSRSFSKFLGILNSWPETMEHTCSEFLGRGDTILRPPIKITYHINGSLGKSYLKGSEGASKEKAYIVTKMS